MRLEIARPSARQAPSPNLLLELLSKHEQLLERLLHALPGCATKGTVSSATQSEFISKRRREDEDASSKRKTSRKRSLTAGTSAESSLSPKGDATQLAQVPDSLFELLSEYKQHQMLLVDVISKLDPRDMISEKNGFGTRNNGSPCTRRSALRADTTGGRISSSRGDIAVRKM